MKKIVAPLAISLLATSTFAADAQTNKVANNAVIKGIAARHNNVIATVVLVIDQINVIIAVPRPIPPSNPENPILK